MNKNSAQITPQRNNSFKPSRPNSNLFQPEPPSQGFSRPKALMCYICGREYGTQSLPIHLKTCEQKWILEQEQKPLKDRKPLPQPPPGINNLLDKGNISRQDIDNYNFGAYDNWTNDVLEQCQNCGRTFKPQSLVHHQQGCRPGKPLKALGGVKDDQFYAETPTGGVMDVVPCRKCGRKFVSERISKHERVCKGERIELGHQDQNTILLSNARGVTQVDTSQRGKQNKMGGGSNGTSWRQKHEEFQANMKYMRQLQHMEAKGGDIRKLPPPPRSTVNNDFKMCPHCGRRFNDEAHTRHIKVCQNIINKPQSIAETIGAKHYGATPTLEPQKQVNFSSDIYEPAYQESPFKKEKPETQKYKYYSENFKNEPKTEIYSKKSVVGYSKAANEHARDYSYGRNIPLGGGGGGGGKIQIVNSNVQSYQLPNKGPSYEADIFQPNNSSQKNFHQQYMPQSNQKSYNNSNINSNNNRAAPTPPPPPPQDNFNIYQTSNMSYGSYGKSSSLSKAAPTQAIDYTSLMPQQSAAGPVQVVGGSTYQVPSSNPFYKY